MSPRPKSADNCVDLGGLGVQFWVPDGNAPVRDLTGGPEFQPPEAAHPDRSGEASIVRLWNMTYYETREWEGPYNPDKKIDNLKKLYGSDLRTSAFGDLLQVQSKASPNASSLNLYRQSEDKTVLFFCWEPPGNDLCKVDINLKSLHLAV